MLDTIIEDFKRKFPETSGLDAQNFLRQACKEYAAWVVEVGQPEEKKLNERYTLKSWWMNAQARDGYNKGLHDYESNMRELIK